MATEMPTGNQTREIQDTISSTRDSIKSAIDKGTERASHLKDAAMERASHLKDLAYDRGKSALASVERVIEERPLAVLGGVFAGGLILGFLLSRK